MRVAEATVEIVVLDGGVAAEFVVSALSVDIDAVRGDLEDLDANLDDDRRGQTNSDDEFAVDEGGGIPVAAGARWGRLPSCQRDQTSPDGTTSYRAIRRSGGDYDTWWWRREAGRRSRRSKGRMGTPRPCCG